MASCDVFFERFACFFKSQIDDTNNFILKISQHFVAVLFFSVLLQSIFAKYVLISLHFPV